MKRLAVALILAASAAISFAQHTGGGGGGVPGGPGGTPGGNAGGALSGSYPNPGLNLAQAHTFTAPQQAPNIDANVMDYGADPTGNADSTTAFTNAIAALTSGGRLLMPCGTFKVNPGSSFTLLSGTIIQGGGPYCTTVTYTGSASTPIWLSNSYVNGTGGNGQFIMFRDFTMQGGNISASVCFNVGTTSTATAKVQNITFENMRVTQCGSGLVVNDVWDLNIIASDFAYNAGDAIDLTDPDAITGMYLFGTRIHNNTGHGVNNTGAGTVTQYEQYGGEVTYNGGTEIVAGISRDWLLSGVWFEEAGSGTAQHAFDVTGCIRCTVIGGHYNFEIDAIYASATVSYITIANSRMTNGTTNFVNVPTGSTYINYAEGNVSNVVSTVGSATAQLDVNCPDATSYTLSSAVGMAVNGCSGVGPLSLYVSGTLEAFLTNTGTWEVKALAALNNSSAGLLTLGTGSVGNSLTRNEADAFSTLTINNVNASSTGDILDVQAAGTNQDGFTPQGIPFHRFSSAVASATTIAPTAPAFHVSGTTTITTITPPTNCTSSAETGCVLHIIPDGLWSTATGGNIDIATTAVVGKLLIMIYDQAQAKWYPSY